VECCEAAGVAAGLVVVAPECCGAVELEVPDVPVVPA